MNIRDAVTEAAENCDRNFTSEPCVVRALLCALDREREKVRVLRDACESICEEWGKNHDAPFCAGSEMEKLATAALEKTEDAT